MGWDLVPRSRMEPFHVTMYAWLHVVANALEHSGADMDKFAYSNDGDYVPAKVARSWADSLEKGISDLKIAVIYHSGNPPFAPGHAIFVVHRSYTEEQTMKDFNRWVGLFDKEVPTWIADGDQVP